MSKGWDNIELLNETIMKFRHAVANIVNKKQQDKGIKLSQEYEERVKELQHHKTEEQTKETIVIDKELPNANSDKCSEEELPKWEDVKHLNNEIKGYEIQLQQQHHENKSVTQPHLKRDSCPT